MLPDLIDPPASITLSAGSFSEPGHGTYPINLALEIRRRRRGQLTVIAYYREFYKL